jgi:hypothetical protein
MASAAEAIAFYMQLFQSPWPAAIFCTLLCLRL